LSAKEAADLRSSRWCSIGTHFENLSCSRQLSMSKLPKAEIESRRRRKLSAKKRRIFVRPDGVASGLTSKT
jgi:hypothetical protein